MHWSCAGDIGTEGKIKSKKLAVVVDQPALTLNLLIFGLVNVAIASATDHYTNIESSSSGKMTAQQQGAQTTLA